MTREFTEWGRGIYNRLPSGLREGLRAAGVCHYMVIVKDRTGDLYSFDFGPVGGDVTGRLAGGVEPLGSSDIDSDREMSASSPCLLSLVEKSSHEQPGLRRVASSVENVLPPPSLSESSSSPSASSSESSPTKRERLRALRSLGLNGGRELLSRSTGKRLTVPGEIREEKLEQLPDGHYFVGHTSLSVDEIRRFNSSRDTMYTLHDNDCRHYLNDLCAHACPEAYQTYGRGGVASRVAWLNTWGRLKSGRPHEAFHLLPLQAITDLRNFDTINRIKSACSASVVFGVGMRALPLLCKPVLAPVGAIASAVSLPGAARVVTAVPARRLVTTAAGAVAGVSAEVPVVREALAVGNVALTGLTDVARGLVAGTSSVVSAGAGLFVSSFSPAASAVSAAAASASATYEAGAVAGASIVAAGTTRGAAAVAAEGAAAVAAEVAGAGAVAVATVAVAQTQAQALATRSLTVTRMAAANRVRAVASRAARATQTIASATVAGLKRISPYPRTWSPPNKRRALRRSSQTLLLPTSTSVSASASSGGARSASLGLQLDAASENKRPKPFISFGRRDGAGAAGHSMFPR